MSLLATAGPGKCDILPWRAAPAVVDEALLQELDPCISSPASRASILVIAADEEVVLARHTADLLVGPPA